MRSCIAITVSEARASGSFIILIEWRYIVLVYSCRGLRSNRWNGVRCSRSCVTRSLLSCSEIFQAIWGVLGVGSGSCWMRRSVLDFPLHSSAKRGEFIVTFHKAPALMPPPAKPPQRATLLVERGRLKSIGQRAARRYVLA